LRPCTCHRPARLCAAWGSQNIACCRRAHASAFLKAAIQERRGQLEATRRR
jgi:hypothetical protein